VRVRQGTLSMDLTAGKQWSTKPAMRIMPIEAQIAWSHNVPAYMALLVLAAEPARTTQSPNLTRVQKSIRCQVVFRGCFHPPRRDQPGWGPRSRAARLRRRYPSRTPSIYSERCDTLPAHCYCLWKGLYLS
jgi:hypothetical protein